MPAVIYASTNEVNSILAALDPQGFAGGQAATQAEVETACYDLDAYGISGRKLANADTFKVLPTALDIGQQNRLKRAVAYQVAYRRRLGPDFFAGAEYDEVSAAGMSRKGQLPKLAPAARQLLVDAGLIHASSRATSDNGNWVTVGHNPLFPWLWR